MNKITVENQNVYRNPAFQNRRFQHQLVESEIAKLNTKIFTIKTLGHSLEKRSINSIVFGKGSIQIMFWSQMHGNEATATAALFDILNFLSWDDQFNELRNAISTKFTLHFLPMINPDGAERFQRENAINVDLNRDALKRSMPETNILLDYQNDIKADIAFNLHDQRTHYNVSGTGKTASISFLAPAFNEEKDVNENREYAMKIIASLNQHLQLEIPNHIARYNDTYGPRCVGDFFQSKGSATILIESGAFKDDPERQYIRALNVTAIINFLIDLEEDNIQNFSLENYFDIPENDEKLYDILIRNVEIDKNEMDIGIRFREFTDFTSRDFTCESFIEEVGDLSHSFGIKEFDAKKFSCELGKILEYDNSKNEIENIRMGNTAILSSDTKLLRSVEHIPYQFSLESSMDFIFKKDNIAEIAIINDKIIDLRNEKIL